MIITKIACFVRFILFFLLTLSPFLGLAESYLVGGSVPIPPDLQKQLDQNTDLVQLGINTKRLMDAKIDPAEFTRAVLFVADSVRQGDVPGAVVYLDSLDGDNIPIAVGYSIVEGRCSQAAANPYTRHCLTNCRYYQYISIYLKL